MIKLVAIDLDGTLFDNTSQVPKENQEAIQYMADHGIYPVVSTGRPLDGIPDTVRALPFAYAITANGAGVYNLSTSECIFEGTMDADIALPILDYLEDKHCNVDAFIQGTGVSTFKCQEHADALALPPSLIKYVRDSRKRVDSLQDYITENHLGVQKMTLNFFNDENGNAIDRPEIKEFLESNPNVDVVCGGYNNLEFTRSGVSKGVGLTKLAEHLGLKIEETMAIGDTENDLSIIQTAGVSVAMANATEEIKEAADYITSSNEESGVAKAIHKFCIQE
ncbi:MAG: HAD family phosphatase [Lachnospiraceae bacterium]|nr:HAD family phosphatase [Lachnospiraceae bacterium]